MRFVVIIVVPRARRGWKVWGQREKAKVADRSLSGLMSYGYGEREGDWKMCTRVLVE